MRGGAEGKGREGKSVSEQRVQHTHRPQTGVLETGFFPGLVLFGSHSVFFFLNWNLMSLYGEHTLLPPWSSPI